MSPRFRDIPLETPPQEPQMSPEGPQDQGCFPQTPLLPPRHGDKGHTTHIRGSGGLGAPPRREQQHTRHGAKKAPRWCLAKSSSLFNYSQQ